MKMCTSSSSRNNIIFGVYIRENKCTSPSLCFAFVLTLKTPVHAARVSFKGNQSWDSEYTSQMWFQTVRTSTYIRTFLQAGRASWGLMKYFFALCCCFLFLPQHQSWDICEFWAEEEEEVLRATSKSSTESCCKKHWGTTNEDTLKSLSY
jgi:hypothetical protein